MTTMKRLSLSVVVSTSAVLVMLGGLCGCATTKAGPQSVAVQSVRAEEYYPLALGNSWTLDRSALGEKAEFTVSIVGFKNGEYEDSTGAHLVIDRDGIRDSKRFLLREPLAAGTKWHNVVSASSVEHYEIVSVGHSCESPAGSWSDCLTVVSRNRIADGRGLVNEMVYAKGVGLVSISTTLEDRGNRIPQVSFVLRRYSLAPAALPSHSSQRSP